MDVAFEAWSSDELDMELEALASIYDGTDHFAITSEAGSYPTRLSLLIPSDAAEGSDAAGGAAWSLRIHLSLGRGYPSPVPATVDRVDVVGGRRSAAAAVQAASTRDALIKVRFGHAHTVQSHSVARHTTVQSRHTHTHTHTHRCQRTHPRALPPFGHALPTRSNPTRSLTHPTRSPDLSLCLSSPHHPTHPKLAEANAADGMPSIFDMAEAARALLLEAEVGEAGGAGEVKETSATPRTQGGRGSIGIGIGIGIGITARKHAITATRRGLEGSLAEAGFTTTLRVSSSEVEDIALMEDTSRCWEHAETATVVVVPSVEEVERCAAGWAGTLEVSSQKVQQEDLEEWVLLSLAAAPFVRIVTKGAEGEPRRRRGTGGGDHGTVLARAAAGGDGGGAELDIADGDTETRNGSVSIFSDGGGGGASDLTWGAELISWVRDYVFCGDDEAAGEDEGGGKDGPAGLGGAAPQSGHDYGMDVGLSKLPTPGEMSEILGREVRRRKSYNIQCSEICTLRNEKFHTEI